MAHFLKRAKIVLDFANSLNEENCEQKPWKLFSAFSF